MKIDIWSDVRCPFCFVGKRKFEKALEQFQNKNDVEVNWHSFQLEPSLETQPDTNPYEYFARSKGMSVQQAKQIHQYAKEAGEKAGIQFNFDESKVANSFHAHQLIQLAKSQQKADEVEELLFEAQFLNSKNIDDENTLIEIGTKAGLKEEDIRNALNSDEFGYLVKQDMQLAAQLGINAVPFFIFNDKYVVSGAQETELFLEVLEKSWEEFSKGDNGLQIIEGDSCDSNGNCN